MSIPSHSQSNIASLQANEVLNSISTMSPTATSLSALPNLEEQSVGGGGGEFSIEDTGDMPVPGRVGEEGWGSSRLRGEGRTVWYAPQSPGKTNALVGYPLVDLRMHGEALSKKTITLKRPSLTKLISVVFVVTFFYL